MRSPRYRSITGRSVRLPLLLVAATTVMTVVMSTLTGWMLGSASWVGVQPGRAAGDGHGRARRPRDTSPFGGDLCHRPDHRRGRGRAGHAGRRRADRTPRSWRPWRMARPARTPRCVGPRADDEVLSVEPTGVVTGRTPGQARVHAVLPPFDASVAVVVGGAETVASWPGRRTAGPGRAGPPGAAAARMGDMDPRAAGSASGRGRRHAARRRADAGRACPAPGRDGPGPAAGPSAPRGGRRRVGGPALARRTCRTAWHGDRARRPCRR